MPTVEEVWNDPDFQGLPSEEKRKVLLQIDKDFAGLPSQEQDKVVGVTGESNPQLTTPVSESSPMMGVAQQAVQAALPSPQFNAPLQPTSANPVMAALQAAVQTMRDPTRLHPTMTNAGGELGAKGAQMLGAGETGQAVGRFAGEMVADPGTYLLGPSVGKAGTTALGKTAATTGEKVLAPAGEVLSATRIKDIARLFKNPKEVLFAPSLKKSGKVMGDVEKALGVTDDELRLIAKAGDRATGGSRTVVEGLIQSGKDRALQAGDKIENWAAHLTPGELIAGRRGASKLTAVAKGREGFIATKDVQAFEQAFVSKAKDKALTYLQALKDQTNARTRSAFMNILPLNKNMSHNALRGTGMIAAGALGHPLAMLAAMPATTGLATLAAKGVHTAGKTVLNNPAVRNTAGAITLATIRKYLQGQQQAPGR